MAGRKEIPRELSIYINDRQVINSLGGVTREITKVNAEMRNLNKNSATYDEDLKRLQKDLVDLKNRQADFKEEIAQTAEVSNEAAESFSKIFLGLTSGNLNLAKEGLLGLRAGLSGLVTSAAAFVATPIGATIAVLSGIALVTKQWFDYNNSIKESTRLIENLSGKTGEVVAQIRLQVQSLADTYNVEFKSIAEAVDNLVDTGVARDELDALNQIKNGLLTAPDANEFIASLENSSLVAKQVGLDLQQVINLKKEIEETGVDPDAVFGALQKASKNLAEQSDNLKLKLSDALGSGFSTEILSKIKSGEITTTQALEAIGKKAQEVGLNQKQQAELTSAIFGKAGVAAGGLISITETLTAAQARQAEGLTPLQEATKELEASNLALQKAQDDLFRSDGFESWKTGLLTTFNQVKTGFYQLLDDLVNGYGSSEERIRQASEKNGLDNYTKDAIKSFEDYLERRKKSMGDQFTFEKVLEERLALVRQNLSKVSGWDATEAEQEMAKRYEAEIDALKQYATKRKEVTKKETDDEIREAKEAAAKKANDEEQARAKRKAADEKEAREKLERAKALAAALAGLAKAELDYYIASNQSKLKDGEKFTEESLAQEYKRLDDIRIRQIKEADNERLAKVAKAEQEGKSAEEINALKEQYYLEYLTKEQTLTLEFQKMTEAQKQQFIADQKQLQLEQLAADNELALLEAQTKEEEAAIKAQQQFDTEIARYRDMLAKKKITQEEYDRFEKEAKENKDALDRQRELNQLNSTLGGIGALAGAVTQLFGQSKEMALVSAGINGAQAITSILAQWPKFDGGFSMYAAIAASVITTAAQIKEITKAKAPKQPKLPRFFFGGNTGTTPALGFDEHGPVTGVVHSNEWVAPQVMTQSPRYAPILSYLETERQRIMGNKFADGGSSSAGTLPPAAVAADSNSALLMAINRLNANLESGIKATARIGYEDAEAINNLVKESNDSTTNGTLNS